MSDINNNDVLGGGNILYYQSSFLWKESLID